MYRVSTLLRQAWSRSSGCSHQLGCPSGRLLTSTSHLNPNDPGTFSGEPGAAPPLPPPPNSDELDGGRRLARLAKMATTFQHVLKTHDHARGQPDDLMEEYNSQINESLDIIRSALDKAGRPCTVEELADRTAEEDLVPIPIDALSYRDYLRAAALRDSFSHSFVDLQIMPPREAYVENEGRILCRLERRAKRRALEDALARGQGADGIVDALQDGVDAEASTTNGDGGVLKELRPVTEEELAKRKAHLEKSTSMEHILRGYETALLEVRRVHKVVKEGTTLSMRALVVIGNRNGTAGYGEGKSETAQHAIERACRDAKRNLLHIDRYQDRTIYHRVKGKFVCTKVSMWPKPRGSGVTGNNNNFAIFHLFGIKDVGAKVHGSRNLVNSVKAVFNALSRLESPESICKSRGLQEIARVPPRTRPNIKYRPL